MTIDDKLERSAEIINRAIAELKPYAVVMMFSGGNDSLTAYHVARYLNVKTDALVHVVTGTGIPETTDFVRSCGEAWPEQYLEANAGSAYEDYVLRKGFFGIGIQAHMFAYHLLKADGFRKLISKHFRQGKRGRNILLINGARQDESDNRMFTMREPIQRENAGSSNYWVNIINDWSKQDCTDFLSGYAIQRNPVAFKLCRSGECMCGTMQRQEERAEAEFWYPKWGAWLADLERRVMERTPWGWGQRVPEFWTKQQQGQLTMPGFLPMCSDCIKRPVIDEDRGD